MSYKALYRKYRPDSFEEVCGQQHVVNTLQNAIKNNKLAHAYLFCGPRGTGKTSIAKLLAKTINCTGEGPKPCGKCPNCIDIQESTHPDVVELDGATNNGVDEIREIVDKVKYAPMQGKYKVYIIDEVHMITPNAFNALLKTLEEPPEYCIFILATTEPHKVLPTIVSRCQRFDFTKLSPALIKERINYICRQENITCEDAAVNLIAELADGGMRDALSILDQCVAYAQDNITAEDVSAVYGIATLQEKIDLFKAVKDQNTEAVVNKVNDFSARGIDLPRLTSDLINMAKEAVIYAYSNNVELLEKLTPEYAGQMRSQFTTTQLLKYIDYLMDTMAKYRDASDPLAYLEVCLLKMIDYAPEYIPVREIPAQPQVNIIQPVETEKPAEKPKAKPAVKREIRKKTDDELYGILSRASKALKEKETPAWNQMLGNKDLKFAAVVNLLQGSYMMADSEKEIIAVVKERIIADNLNDQDNVRLVEELCEEKFGIRKDIYAITEDEKTFLINYFRARKSQPEPEPVKKEEPEPEEPENDVEAKLKYLFGSNGYNIIKE